MLKKQLNTRHLRMDCPQILEPSQQIADWSVLEMLCYINQNEEQNVKSWHFDYFSFFYASRQSCKRPACRGRERERNIFILSRDFNHWHLSFSPLFFQDQIFMRKKQGPRLHTAQWINWPQSWHKFSNVLVPSLLGQGGIFYVAFQRHMTSLCIEILQFGRVNSHWRRWAKHQFFLHPYFLSLRCAISKWVQWKTVIFIPSGGISSASYRHH